MSEIVKVPVLPVWQPWAWYLVHGYEHPGGKRVESRSRPLPKTLAGRWCLIHATVSPGLLLSGQMSRPLAVEFLDAWDLATASGAVRAGLDEWNKMLDSLQFGGLVGAVRWMGCYEPATPSYRGEGHGPHDMPDGWQKWGDLTSPFWWLTADARPLPFVPWRGQQGVFYVPRAGLPAEYRELFEEADR